MAALKEGLSGDITPLVISDVFLYQRAHKGTGMRSGAQLGCCLIRGHLPAGAGSRTQAP